MKNFVLLLTTALITGCSAGAAKYAPDEKDKAELLAAGIPEALHQSFWQIDNGPQAGRMANQLDAAMYAMTLGHNDLAASTFDNALLTIETIYGNDERAKTARSKYREEESKVFRGEPYERAMAYHYRGLLYLMEHDYENARASFKSGFLQDSLAIQEEYRGDFAMLALLDGWASQCNGDADLAKVAYALAKKHNSELVVPNAQHNTLVLADLGMGPEKYTEGEHNELLKFRAQETYITPEVNFPVAWQNSGGARLQLPNSESVLWQATTRGGREFDYILAGKAQFKESSETAAEIGAAVSAAAMSVSDIQSSYGDYDAALTSAGIGAAAGVFSWFKKIQADATKPGADTRQWHHLPEKVAYGTFSVDGLDNPTVEFGGGTNNQIVYKTGGNCAVVWATTPIPPEWEQR